MRCFTLLLTLLVLACQALQADVMISEFLADNVTGLKDEDDTRQDWIELYNSGSAAVSLDGWWLTDNAAQPMKWEFPSVSIPAGGTLLVWASGKDRRVAGQPLHTNFSLGKSGEYLGIHKPVAGTGLPEMVDQYSPAFPAQATDVSYGVSFAQTTTTFVASNQAAKYRVLSNDATGAANYTGSNYAAGNVGTGLSGGWNVSPSFADSSWTACTTGLGYDTGGGLNAWIVTDCRIGFQGVNTSLLFRRTFSVPNPATYSTFKLRMKYEDGFVAYLNGTEIGRANFSGSPAYNSKATAALDETTVNSWTEFVIPSSAVLAGNNVLAIQGLNSSVSSSDFLLLPEITGATGIMPGTRGYFSTATPNSLNGATTSGPIAYGALPEDPNVPRPTEADPQNGASVLAMEVEVQGC